MVTLTALPQIPLDSVKDVAELAVAEAGPSRVGANTSCEPFQERLVP